MDASRNLGVFLFALGFIACVGGLFSYSGTTLATQSLVIATNASQTAPGLPGVFVISGSLFALIGLYIYSSTR